MSKILIKSALERRKIDKIVSLSIDINEIDRGKQGVFVSVNPNWMHVNVIVYYDSILRNVRLGAKIDITSNSIDYNIIDIDFYHTNHKELNKCIKTLEYIKELLTKNNN